VVRQSIRSCASRWRRSRLLRGQVQAPPVDGDAPSLFAALQEQLGLKLESARAPVPVIVVDRIEKPALD